DLEIASQGQAVAIQLDTDIDVARGSVLSKGDTPPLAARVLETRMVWLSETPYDPRGSYLLRTTTDLAPVSHLKISSLLNLETLEVHEADACAANDIAIGTIALGRTAAVD